MAWQDLPWRNCGAPLSEERLQEVEESLGVAFPDDFRECVKQCHGGTPSKNRFQVPASRGEFGSCVGMLLSFDKDNDDSIEAAFEDLEFRPDGIIPFAEDGGGDFICFDYNKVNDDGTPTVL